MNRCSLVVALWSCVAAVATALDAPKSLVSGLNNPAAVCFGPKGFLYVTEAGEVNRDGDGKVKVIRDGQPQDFATGLDDPLGIVFFRDALYVADKTRIVRIDQNGQTTNYMMAKDFPAPPKALRGLAIDAPNGIFLVSDAGDERGQGGAIYRIDVRLNTIDMIASQASTPELQSPRGVVFDGASFALVANSGAQAILRIKLKDGSAQPIATRTEGAESLAWDHFGRLYFSSRTTGQILAIPRPGELPVVIANASSVAAELCLDASGQRLIVTNTQSGALTSVATAIPGWEVDQSPLPVDIKLAFPNLRWTGWDDGSESGKISSLRPILLTHAGDGSNRVFVPTQQGVIHVFDNNDLTATKTKIFLDLTDRVRFTEKENEEGFLGLAFHPNYAKNGELFVFYTDAKATGVNVVSRFRVKRDDPNAADPASEEQLICFEKPHWNHDGGTVVFGPDGYLYIAHGDGGSGGDPHENGQNLATLLGKVLRIDVDNKSNGKNYAIPADNPFRKDTGAAPEIWAYGLRNVWRMAFDRKTGKLWAGEVGQNLFEEIVLLQAGGNYGWSLREGLHPFGDKGTDVRESIVEPIWEYDHELGKSITGGIVYRGKQVPELNGTYLYGDFVTARLWALRYDPVKQRVVGNHPINTIRMAAMSFGEDEQGEAYVMESTANGRGIYRFVQATGK